MADMGENMNGDQWAKATFIMTIVCAVMFVAAAVFFVLRVE
jgi:hypothetical protein